MGNILNSKYNTNQSAMSTLASQISCVQLYPYTLPQNLSHLRALKCMCKSSEGEKQVRKHVNVWGRWMVYCYERFMALCTSPPSWWRVKIDLIPRLILILQNPPEVPKHCGIHQSNLEHSRHFYIIPSLQ